MKGCERTMNTGCCLCYPDQAVKAKKHRDSTRRRRSANADILESFGLPTTGSFNDMKSLQGSTLCEVSRSEDSFCGLRRAIRSITRAVKASSESRTTTRKSTKRDASSKFTANKMAPMALTKEELCLLPTARNKLQEGDVLVHSCAPNETHDQELQLETPQMPAWRLSESVSHLGQSTAMMPAQWLRRRSAFSDLTSNRKGW